MWKHKLNKVSRTILSNYSHGFVSLKCMQFKPNQDLKYGLPIPSRDSVFFMIKPDENVLGLYVLSNELYHSSLSKLGEIEDCDFNFTEITDKNLFLAVHKDGHFFQKINIVDVIEEISTFAHLSNSTFIFQLNTIDLNLSRLSSRISDRLVNIRRLITVRRESGNYTKDHRERHRDLDNFGDEIIKSLGSGVCSSGVIWCFSSNPPNVAFPTSKASISWVNVDSSVISKNVSIGDKFMRLFKKSKNTRISDIFSTLGKDTVLIKFDISRIIKDEISRYLFGRKNSPVFFFDGSVVLHQKNIQSSKTVDSDNRTKSESFEGVGY